MRAIGGLTLGAVLLLGCPAGFANLCDNGACDSDASVDGSSDSGQCDPKTQNCVDPQNGLFVSPAGSDSDDGSQTHPVKSIGVGVTKAKAAGKSKLYVCTGTYAETVTLKDSLSIFGGLSCSDWSYSATNTVTVSPASGYGLHVITTSVFVSDVHFMAADGASPGDSSIAGFADTSTVTLLRSKFTAGKGVTGTDGTTGSNYAPIGQNDPSIKGHDGTGIAGGSTHACTGCTDNNNSMGGFGGNGGNAPADGQDGGPSLGGQAPTDGKAGTRDPDMGGAMKCAIGDDGANGDAGANALSPTTLGSLDSAGWKPSVGSSGTNGTVAQGGGGGGGGYDGTNASGAGGGGGCGGCGGAGGAGGGAGGASIALLALNSTVIVTTSEFHATNAGNGGSGVSGQSGQLGGFSGQNINPGCSGGTGGAGGSGGAGAGGPGGLSAGILWKGTKPNLDAASQAAITIASGVGAKGAGGKPGVNDGIDGVAQVIYQLL